MSTTPSGATARETICRTAWSSSSSGLRLARRALGEHRPHGLEEGHVVADAQRLVVRHGQRERLRQLPHGAAAAGPCRPPAPGCAPAPRAAGRAAPAACPVIHFDQSKPWKRPQQTSYFSSITATASSWSMRRAARAAALGVGGERLP